MSRALLGHKSGLITFQVGPYWYTPGLIRFWKIEIFKSKFQEHYEVKKKTEIPKLQMINEIYMHKKNQQKNQTKARNRQNKKTGLYLAQVPYMVRPSHSLPPYLGLQDSAH